VQLDFFISRGAAEAVVMQEEGRLEARLAILEDQASDEAGLPAAQQLEFTLLQECLHVLRRARARIAQLV
jgi:hypothetical protein